MDVSSRNGEGGRKALGSSRARTVLEAGLVMVLLAGTSAACSTPSTAEREPTVLPDTTAVDTVAPLPRLIEVPRTGLTPGPPPRLPYVHQRTVRLPDGTRVPLERPKDPFLGLEENAGVTTDVSGMSYTSLTHFAAGWVGRTYDSMQEDTTFHRPDGSFDRYLEPNGGTGEPAVSADGRWILFATNEGVEELDARTPDRSRRILPAYGSQGRTRYVPVGYTGRRTAVVNVIDGEGGRSLRVLLVSPDGERRVLPGIRRAAATSRELIIGSTRRGPVAKADTVVDHDGEVILPPSGLELEAFNPDGTMAVGRESVNSHRVVVVSLATGDPVLHVRAPGSVAWEDGEHLLITRFRPQRDRMAVELVRLSIDGMWELALHTTVAVTSNLIAFPLVTEPARQDHPIGG